MKVQINIVPEENEEEVIFRIHGMNEQINQTIRILTSKEENTPFLLCKKEEKCYKIPIREIFYLESVDRKVFVYTVKDTFKVDGRLYELEEKLLNFGFIRISKSMLLNFDKIYSFYPRLSGNLEAILVNEEKVAISRRYVAGLKKKLGMEDSECLEK